MAAKKKGSTAGNVKLTGKSGKEAASPSKFSPGQIKEFVREVKAEFNKIVWPDRKVTVGLTGFVVLLVTVISIYLGTVDLLLGKLVTMVLR